MTMLLSDPIFVAGHNGLVDSALVRMLRRRGFTNLCCAPVPSWISAASQTQAAVGHQGKLFWIPVSQMEYHGN